VLACWCNLKTVKDAERFVAETLAFTFRGLFSQSFCDPANQIWSSFLVPETKGNRLSKRLPCLVQSALTKCSFHC
jgi:hypothetical protein